MLALVNGKTVIQSASGISQEEAVRKARVNKKVIETDTKKSSLSFMNKEASDRWKVEDTNKFYKGL